MIEIRTAALEEIPAMREVAIESYVTKFGAYNTQEDMDIFLKEVYNLEQLTKEFYEPGSALYLALHEGQVVGFVRLRNNVEVDSYLGKNHIELQRLYVHSKFQNMKIGKLLLEQAFRYAQEHKFEWIWLGVWEKNFEAQRFYQRWGFEKFSEHVFLMGNDPQIDWLLKKKMN